MKTPYHPNLILERQGISATVRTSSHCRLWNTEFVTKINEIGATQDEAAHFRYRCGSAHGKAATLQDAVRAIEAYLGEAFGEVVTFYPFIESYGAKAVQGDKHFAFCFYEAGSGTIRLHRSNVCLVAFDSDGLTTCDGTPRLFTDDAANMAYRPLVASAIGSVIGQNCQGNDRLWLTWLISQYIHNNALGTFPNNEPQMACDPTFPIDMESPTITPTFSR